MVFNLISLWNTKSILLNQIYTNPSIPFEWQVILLGDGSFTRHSEILSYSDSSLEHLSTYAYIKSKCNTVLYVNRQILISNKQRERLVFASSWWYVAEYETIYRYPSKAIGSFLIQSEMDFYRDIHEIFFGYSLGLEKLFVLKGPFWGRCYTLCHKRKPIALVYEIFSPLLGNFQ